MGGHAFSARRAFDLATYCRAEALPFHNCANPRVLPQPVKPARNDKSKGLNDAFRLRSGQALEVVSLQNRSETGVFPQPPRLDSAPAQCIRIGW